MNPRFLLALVALTACAKTPPDVEPEVVPEPVSNVRIAPAERPVAYGEERLREAARQGFTTAIVPKDNAPRAPIEGLRVRAFERLDEALRAALG